MKTPSFVHSFLFFSPLFVSAAPTQQQVAATFDPWAYKKTFVTCPAVDRSGPTLQKIELKLGYLDINPTAKKTLILAHGWPSLWTTYRHQIEHFKNSEYRLIIPEHRGYGDSQHPKDLGSSNNFNDFVDDILCMMNNAKVDSGVCVGNDFGAQVCWTAGRQRPDKFTGVFNVGIPYISSERGFSPAAAIAALNPSFSYQVYLGLNPTGAAKELDANPRDSIRSCAQMGNSTIPKDFLKKTTTFLGPWKEFEEQNDLTEIPFTGIMTEEVEDYMVESYKKQGFYNTFNGYQLNNRKATHDFEVAQGNFTLSQPTFTLFPTLDPVSDWAKFAASVKEDSYLKNHKTAKIATAHWPQEEKPDEFNQILEEWLKTVKF